MCNGQQPQPMGSGGGGGYNGSPFQMDSFQSPFQSYGSAFGYQPPPDPSQGAAPGTDPNANAGGTSNANSQPMSMKMMDVPGGGGQFPFSTGQFDPSSFMNFMQSYYQPPPLLPPWMFGQPNTPVGAQPVNPPPGQPPAPPVQPRPSGLPEPVQPPAPPPPPPPPDPSSGSLPTNTSVQNGALTFNGGNPVPLSSVMANMLGFTNNGKGQYVNAQGQVAGLVQG